MKLAVPYFRQFNSRACTPACFQMVAKYWGTDINQRELFKKTYVGPGASLTLAGTELIKKGFTFVAFWNRQQWLRKEEKAEVKKYLKRYKKALEAGMIHKQDVKISVIKKYLDYGMPILTEVCCNNLYDDPKDKDYHLIVVVGHRGKGFLYHDPYLKKGGAFKRISEAKLKAAWVSLPFGIPAFYVVIPRIIITGTPCTGKSTAAEVLGKKLKLPVIHVTELIKERKIGTKKGREVEVDLKKLRGELLKARGIIESHLLCEFGLPNSVVFVLRCNPAVLEKRMRRRRYSKQKIRENLECEALDYCTLLAEKNYKKVFDIDATRRTPRQTADKIIRLLAGRARPDKVDFSNWLLSSR